MWVLNAKPQGIRCLFIALFRDFVSEFRNLDPTQMYHKQLQHPAENVRVFILTQIIEPVFTLFLRVLTFVPDCEGFPVFNTKKSAHWSMRHEHPSYSPETKSSKPRSSVRKAQTVPVIGHGQNNLLNAIYNSAFNAGCEIPLALLLRVCHCSDNFIEPK